MAQVISHSKRCRLIISRSLLFKWILLDKQGIYQISQLSDGITCRVTSIEICLSKWSYKVFVRRQEAALIKLMRDFMETSEQNMTCTQSCTHYSTNAFSKNGWNMNFPKKYGYTIWLVNSKMSDGDATRINKMYKMYYNHTTGTITKGIVIDWLEFTS